MKTAIFFLLSRFSRNQIFTQNSALLPLFLLYGKSYGGETFFTHTGHYLGCVYFIISKHIALENFGSCYKTYTSKTNTQFMRYVWYVCFSFQTVRYMKKPKNITHRKSCLACIKKFQLDRKQYLGVRGRKRELF